MSKTFEKNKPNEGKTILKKLYYYLKPNKQPIRALQDISINVKKGEFVGLVGPNGAGKTTLVKILTGILTPEKGKATCLGQIPYIDRVKYVKDIGVVFGSRNILEYHIAVKESLLLYSVIYDLNKNEANERIDFLAKLLDIEHLLDTPVRKLSLGERMRCNLAASFLHKPKIVYLDEPTIGLDALAKERIREFLKNINKTEKTTIILTTHDMDDIEEMCERIIFIKSKCLYDGKLTTFKNQYMVKKYLKVNYSNIKDKKLFENARKDITILKEGISYFEGEILKNNKNNIGTVISNLFQSIEIIDLDVKEQSLEEIIKEIYVKERGIKL